MKNQITPEKSVNTESNSKELILGILLTVAILDHTRLFFHYWNTNPGNLDSTTPMLFFTRFISHFFPAWPPYARALSIAGRLKKTNCCCLVIGCWLLVAGAA